MKKKVEKLLRIEFDSKLVCGDNDKYIKTKIKICGGNNKFSKHKNVKRKSTMQVFVNNNARFCCQSKENVLSPNTLGGIQIWTIKDKNGEPYWWRFRKKFDESDNDSNGHESESDGHETESDGESNNKSLIVYANHALLGFYFCLTV